MSDNRDNQWPLLLRLLAAGGFGRGRGREQEHDEQLPDSFPTRDVTWEGEQYTAVELPTNDQWLLVRPSFWQQVVAQARSLRERISGATPDAPIDPDIWRRHLVAQLLRAGSLTDPLVTRAMLQVPRHLFLPKETLERAYADEAVVTRRTGATTISSASQPSMVAIMLEQLGVEQGMRVLEIGAGTGYNAALLAELVGPHGRVTTIDIDQDIVDEAHRNLDSAGYQTVRTICGDGAQGFEPDAPYDRIILTVGAYDIAPAWHDQLAEGGVLLMPLTLGSGELSVAFERHGVALRSRSAFPCGFIRLRGLMAPPDLHVTSDGLHCVISEGQGIAPAELEAALNAPPQATPYNLPFGHDNWRAWSAFAMFCTAQGDRLVQCYDRDGLLGQSGQALTGLYLPDHGSLALLDIAQRRIWSLGGDDAANTLRERLQSFVAVGFHQSRRVAIEAHPAGSVQTPPAHALLIRRPQTDLVVWL